MIDFGAAVGGPSQDTPKQRVGAAVARKDPFDLTPFKKQFAPYREKVDEMRAAADAHQIVDDDSNREAVEMAGQTKQLLKEIEKQRKAAVEEPNKFVKSVNAFCRDFTDRLKGIESGLKRKIGSFAHEKELRRREEERRAREEAEALQKKLDAEAKAKNVEPVKVAPPVTKPEPAVTRTDAGSATIRKVWKWEVEDFAALPDEYKEVKNTALNQAVRSGVRNIAGVRIYQEEEVAMRF